MSRRSSDNSTSAKTKAAIKSARTRIDKLDLQILKLINERAKLAAELGKLKSDQGKEIFAPAREEEVFQNVIKANKGPLDDATVRAVFREIMSGSRALQRVLKVAYLGPEYSFSHLAAIERFGQDIEFAQVGSIAAVFEEVNRGHVDFGVVPLENSTDGRVTDTLDMFLRLPQIKIVAEVRLRMHYHLLANCEQQEIRRVYAIPQAFAQCRNWLSKNIPHAALHEVASTKTAANLAVKEPGAAAVASRQVAVHFGLRILFEDIQDSPYDETRFAVIGHQECGRTGNDKTAIVFRVAHSPGALVDVLSIFKQNKLNLTWIESFPAKTSGGKPKYVFFAEFEGHQSEAKVKRALAELEKKCEQLNVLGSFPIATVSG